MRIFSFRARPALLAAMALLVPAASVLYLVLSDTGRSQMLSEKQLITAYHELEPEARRPIYYLNYLPASAVYYTSGQISRLSGASKNLPAHGFWLAVHKTDGDASNWDCSLQFQPKQGIFDLYLCQERI